MRELALKAARIALAVGVITSFVWLNWWLLPNLAFVTLAPKGLALPVTGYTLDGYQDGKYDGTRIVTDFSRGWTGVAAGWPYVFIGLLMGLSMGYILGEYSRRTFGKEEITKEKETECQDKLRSASEKESSAIRMLALALEWKVDIEKTTKNSIEEQKQARLMEEQARQQQLISEDKLKKLEMKDKDVANMRDKAKRLEAKIEKLEKTIDGLTKEQ